MIHEIAAATIAREMALADWWLNLLLFLPLTGWALAFKKLSKRFSRRPMLTMSAVCGCAGLIVLSGALVR